MRAYFRSEWHLAEDFQCWFLPISSSDGTCIGNTRYAGSWSVASDLIHFRLIAYDRASFIVDYWANKCIHFSSVGAFRARWWPIKQQPIIAGSFFIFFVVCVFFFFPILLVLFLCCFCLCFCFLSRWYGALSSRFLRDANWQEKRLVRCVTGHKLRPTRKLEEERRGGGRKEEGKKQYNQKKKKGRRRRRRRREENKSTATKSRGDSWRRKWAH